MKNTEQERAEFETWAVSKTYSVKRHEGACHYASKQTQLLWQAWQAARRAPVAPEDTIRFDFDFTSELQAMREENAARRAPVVPDEPVGLTDTDVARIYRDHSGAQRFDKYTREFAQRISDFRDDQWRLAAAPQPPEPPTK